MALAAMVVMWHRRAARLRSGEFASYDFSRPDELAYCSAVQLAVSGFPRDLLALPPNSVGKLTSAPIDGGQRGRCSQARITGGQSRPAVFSTKALPPRPSGFQASPRISRMVVVLPAQ